MLTFLSCLFKYFEPFIHQRLWFWSVTLTEVCWGLVLKYVTTLKITWDLLMISIKVYAFCAANPFFITRANTVESTVRNSLLDKVVPYSQTMKISMAVFINGLCWWEYKVVFFAPFIHLFMLLTLFMGYLGSHNLICDEIVDKRNTL